MYVAETGFRRCARFIDAQRLAGANCRVRRSFFPQSDKRLALRMTSVLLSICSKAAVADWHGSGPRRSARQIVHQESQQK